MSKNEYQGSVQSCDSTCDQNVKITARDGIKLATDIYFPALNETKVKHTPSQEIDDPISFLLNLILDLINKSDPILQKIILETLPVKLIIPLNI